MVGRTARRVGGVAVVAAAVLLLPAAVDATLVRDGPARVTFVALGNRGVRVVGHSSTLWVSDTRHGITVMVPLATLRTGIALRDRHLRQRYLEVERFPTVRLDVPWDAVQRPPPGGTVTAEAEGTLQLHGQARPVRFRYAATDEAGHIRVEGRFLVDLRDFGIEVPHFLGIHLRPVVDAGASFPVSERR